MEEAMKLFCVHGYEAVSIRTIADCVGIANSALYKHYKSKHEILEAIVDYSKEYYLSVGSTWMTGITSVEDLERACLQMFHFQTQDAWIVMFRKLLMLERFHNEEMEEIFQSFFIELPINSQAVLFQNLMEKNIMRRNDPYVLAMQLYAPFFLYHTKTNVTSDMEARLISHVHSFSDMYIFS